MKMHRPKADVLDFMAPFRAKMLKQGDDRAKHMDPQHDALIAEVQRREKDPDATPRP